MSILYPSRILPRTIERTTRLFLLFLLPLFWVGCNNGKPEESVTSELFCPTGTLKTGGYCLVECPDLWSRGPDNKCRPPCLEDQDLVDGECIPPCPTGTMKDGNVCLPEYAVEVSECPTDVYNEIGAVGELFYVNQNDNSSEGDGSRASPFTTLRRAFEALESVTSPEVSLVIAAGDYTIADLQVVLPDEIVKVAILGRCAEETTFIGDPETHGLYLDALNTEIIFERLGFESGLSQIQATEALSMTIEHCDFRNWTDSAVMYWGIPSTIDSFVLRNNTFLYNDTGDASSLTIYGVDEVNIENNRFEISNVGGIGIQVEDPLSAAFVGNTMNGSGLIGTVFLLDRRVDKIDIRENNFDGKWITAAMQILGSEISSAVVSIDSNYLENHTSLDDSRSVVLDLKTLADVSIRDLRVENGNVDAISMKDIGSLSISNSAFRNIVWSGLRGEESGIGVFATHSVTVSNSLFAGMQDWAIYQADAHCDLNLSANIIEDNRKGIYSASKTLTATGNIVAANEGIGIQASGADSVKLFGNDIVSNGSFGLDLVALGDDPAGSHQIEDNRVIDCMAVGISLRNTGSGEVLLSNNTISGTRGATLSSTTGETGEAGDGVSIVSYSGDSKTVVKMVDNVVSVNARLGVIVHGSGSTLEASTTDFQDGNGYLGLISADQSDSANLLTQDQAVVTGADAEKAEEVHDLFVVEAPPKDTDED